VTNKIFKDLNVNELFPWATAHLLPFRMGHDTEDAIITLLQKFFFFFMGTLLQKLKMVYTKKKKKVKK